MTAYADTISSPRDRDRSTAEQRRPLKSLASTLDGVPGPRHLQPCDGCGRARAPRARRRRRVRRRRTRLGAASPCACSSVPRRSPSRRRAAARTPCAPSSSGSHDVSAGRDHHAGTTSVVSRLGRRLSARQPGHLFGVWQERAGSERHVGFTVLRHHACSAPSAGSRRTSGSRSSRATEVGGDDQHLHAPTDDELLRAVQGTWSAEPRRARRPTCRTEPNARVLGFLSGVRFEIAGLLGFPKLTHFGNGPRHSPAGARATKNGPSPSAGCRHGGPIPACRRRGPAW